MKFLSLVVLGSAILLGGCASTGTSEKTAAVAEESYVTLGSSIPKKNGKRAEEKTIDLQQLENERTMNNGVVNGH